MVEQWCGPNSKAKSSTVEGVKERWLYQAYIQTKKNWKRAVNAAKKSAEEDFATFLEEKIAEKVLKIAKQMKAENCDAVGDNCIKNGKGEWLFTLLLRNIPGMERALWERILWVQKAWYLGLNHSRQSECEICPDQNEERKSFWDTWCCNKNVVGLRWSWLREDG